jgi:hypothetical protein
MVGSVIKVKGKRPKGKMESKQFAKWQSNIGIMENWN